MHLSHCMAVLPPRKASLPARRVIRGIFQVVAPCPTFRGRPAWEGPGRGPAGGSEGKVRRVCRNQYRRGVPILQCGSETHELCPSLRRNVAE